MEDDEGGDPHSGVWTWSSLTYSIPGRPAGSQKDCKGLLKGCTEYSVLVGVFHGYVDPDRGVLVLAYESDPRLCGYGPRGALVHGNFLVHGYADLSLGGTGPRLSHSTFFFCE